MLKDGMKRRESLGSSYCLSGWSGAGPASGIRPTWNTFADTNGRPFVRCRPSLLPRRSQALHPSPSGRAAGRSPFLSLVQFKENACRGHAPIHSYRFASLVDTQYLSASLCEFVSSKYGILSYDTDCIPENCSTFPSMRSLIFCPCCFITI